MALRMATGSAARLCRRRLAALPHCRPCGARRPVAAAAAAPAAAEAATAPPPPAAAAPAHAAASSAAPPLPPLSFAGRHGLYDEAGLLMLKNLTFEEVAEWCESVGEGPRRADQVWRAMYGDGRWARAWAEGAGGAGAFSRAFQEKAGAAATLHGGLTLQSAHTAPDGTHKLVFALHGGGGAASGSVETVLIPMFNRDRSQPRYTACVSTQVGCAMNCQFCYTGRMGLLGNLSAAQVVEQIVEARRWLAAQQAQQQGQQQQRQQQQGQQQGQPGQAAEARRADALAAGPSGGMGEGGSGGGGSEASGLEQRLASHAAAGASGDALGSGDAGSSSDSGSPASSGGGSSKGKRRPPAPPRIVNVVFMGMGEPLHNMGATMPALDIMCSPTGLALSKNKVIVSTVGLVPQLRELRASGKAKIAVSLHATTDEVRSWIAPVNRKHDLAELMGALAEMFPASLAGTPGRSDDFVILEYVMLAGVNDTDDDARRLLELTEGVYCMVNLIIFNAHEGTRFTGSAPERVRAFQQILQRGGRVCTVRASKGAPEAAACGMLGEGPAANPRGGAPLLKPPPRLRAAVAGEAPA